MIAVLLRFVSKNDWLRPWRSWDAVLSYKWMDLGVNQIDQVLGVPRLTPFFLSSFSFLIVSIF